jgi:hypothetical protein
MRAVPPTEILLRTEQSTLVFERIGESKIRSSARSWGDAKVVLQGQVLEGAGDRRAASHPAQGEGRGAGRGRPPGLTLQVTRLTLQRNAPDVTA